MKRFARITAIGPDHIEAVLEPAPTCAGCQGGCARQSFRWLTGGQSDRLLIQRHSATPLVRPGLVDKQGFFSKSIQVGDRFCLEFNENAMARFALSLYAMPLAMLVLGLGTFYGIFSALDWPADAGGVIGAIVGLGLSRWFIVRLPGTASVRFS